MKVAMVVNNGMANDARVVKSAISLARAGAEVTAFGVAPPGTAHAEATAHGVRFVRLPVLPARGATPAYVTWAARRRLGRLAGDQDWRRSVVVTQYYRRHFVPALLGFNPDVIHAHDVHLLGAATDAARLAGAPGPTRPAVIYDAHEYVASLAVSGARTSRVVTGWRALERECLPGARRVITVSPQIAARLKADNDLADEPTVVYNAPLAFGEVNASKDLRVEAGVGRDVPLVVYSGGLSTQRGLGTVIEALAHLDGVHLAVVAVPFPHKMEPELRGLAQTHGVSDRLHIVPPVPSHEVPAYLSGADIGIHPMLGDIPNHEMALPNKLFEFIHAGLTVVCSSVEAMSTFVRTHDLGEVFTYGDPVACADAVRRALASPSRADTTALREEFSWQTQERVLVDVYRSLGSERPGAEDLAVPSEPWRSRDLQLRFS